jgi:hypothetical protein
LDFGIFWSLGFALPAEALAKAGVLGFIWSLRFVIWNLFFGACDLRFGIYSLELVI